MTKAAHTGHRPQSLDGDFTLKSDFWQRVEKETLLAWDTLGVDSVVSGMALGYDTLVARMAVAQGIPFEAAIPFVGQEQRWPKESKEEYAALLALAAKVTVVCTGGYAAWKMQKRNEYMVDGLDVDKDALVALYNGSVGGTMNAYDYAVKKDKNIWRIDPSKW